MGKIMNTDCNATKKTITNEKSTEKSLLLKEILSRQIFKQIKAIVLPVFEKNATHDLSHSLRVAKNGLTIAAIEGGDNEILVAAALLHDIVSLEKNHPTAYKSSAMAAEKSKKILKKVGFPKEKIAITLDAILCHSFSAGLTPTTHEGKIFQDADRLDGLGAIGIARTFATGGRFNSTLYSEYDPFLRDDRTPNDKKIILDHFFVKLFKLPAKMWTKTGKALAHDRIISMHNFLRILEKEID